MRSTFLHTQAVYSAYWDISSIDLNQKSLLEGGSGPETGADQMERCDCLTKTPPLSPSCVCQSVTRMEKRLRARALTFGPVRVGWTCPVVANLSQSFGSISPSLWCRLHQITRLHPEWRKPMTEKSARCASCTRLEKKNAHAVACSLSLCISFSLLPFFFIESGKPEAACVAQWGSTRSQGSRAMWSTMRDGNRWRRGEGGYLRYHHQQELSSHRNPYSTALRPFPRPAWNNAHNKANLLAQRCWDCSARVSLGELSGC